MNDYTNSPESPLAIPFAHLVDRLSRIEGKLDTWLTARRAVTANMSPPVDTSELPVEPLHEGVVRTLSRPARGA
jgi:hypothetical protein